MLARTTLAGASTAILSIGAWSVAGSALASDETSTPSQTGCPAAYSLLSVADLTAQGYHLPQKLDDPANGGNNDGQVCGRPVQQQAADQHCGGPCPVPVLYDFRDDTLTPSH
jgi:hypothetical protein